MTVGMSSSVYVYDPFGQATVLDAEWDVRPGGSAYDWRYLHQGGRYDVTSGLYHFRFRDYSPTLGRWTSLDPLRYDAGDVNLYRTVGNNPLNSLDPNGLQDLGERAYHAGKAFAGITDKEKKIPGKDTVIRDFKAAAARNKIDPKIVQQILDATTSTPKPRWYNPCKIWAETAFAKMPPMKPTGEVIGAEKVYVSIVAWTFVPCSENLWCLLADGHFAIQVKFPDGSVFYFDDGDWGGVFTKRDIPKYAK